MEETKCLKPSPIAAASSRSEWTALIRVRFALDSPLEGDRFEPSVPRKAVPALGYSLLIMNSLSAADSAPQTLPLRPASCRTLA